MVQKDQHTSRPVWAGVDFSLKENASNRKKTKGNASRHNEKAIGCKRKRDRGAREQRKTLTNKWRHRGAEEDKGIHCETKRNKWSQWESEVNKVRII